MEVRTAETIGQAFRPADVSPARAPEAVFVGRSNVGKSSLINRLLKRRNLARVSKTPGKTRGAFFYGVNGGKLEVVDLPGYGFAKGAQREQGVWQELSATILERPGDRVLILLIDLRHGPQAIDLDARQWFGELTDNLLVVGTKADKLKKAALERQCRLLGKAFDQKILPVSAETGAGIRELWGAVRTALDPGRSPHS